MTTAGDVATTAHWLCGALMVLPLEACVTAWRATPHRVTAVVDATGLGTVDGRDRKLGGHPVSAAHSSVPPFQEKKRPLACVMTPSPSLPL
jgi:hypothetical protein